MDERAPAVRPDACQEAVQECRELRSEVKFLSTLLRSIQAQVAVLDDREHQRDVINQMIAGGGAAYGRRSTDRPALRAVPGTA